MLQAALDGGDVAAVQLRIKDAPKEAIREAAALLRPICQDRAIAFILNDDAELAVELGCDGVHIGADDMPYAAARKIVGPGAIVGVSCYDSRHRAMEVAEQGADYVAFGAFYPTATKEPRGHPAPEILTDWSTATTVPCVAIGGIAVENCRPLVAAGADFLAVVSGIWDRAGGPRQAVTDFNDAIAGALETRG